MPTQKKASTKPKLSAEFKKKLGGRMEQVDIKVGFVNALSIKLTNEQIEAIILGMEQMESYDSYYEIPDQDWGTDLVACVVQTMGEEDEGFEAITSVKMKKSMEKAGVEANLIQNVYWKIKCEATPNNALLTWMSEEQYAALDYLTIYVFIGIRQKQWSVKKLDEDGEVVKGKDGKTVYKNYDKEPTDPEVKAYESHSLKLVDFIV